MRMRKTQSFAPSSILCSKGTLLITAFITHNHAPLIVKLHVSTIKKCWRLQILHHIAHRLAGPHPVYPCRRMREQLTETEITHLDSI